MNTIIVAMVTALAVGFGAAWSIQGIRLDKERDKYNTLETNVKSAGQVANVVNKAKTDADLQLKKAADRDYQTSIARLNSDVKRLRDARSSRSYLPAAPAGSRSPALACFDRSELEQSIKQLDAGLSGLTEEGDAATIAINSLRGWAQTLRTSPPESLPEIQLR